MKHCIKLSVWTMTVKSFGGKYRRDFSFHLKKKKLKHCIKLSVWTMTVKSFGGKYRRDFSFHLKKKMKHCIKLSVWTMTVKSWSQRGSCVFAASLCTCQYSRLVCMSSLMAGPSAVHLLFVYGIHHGFGVAISQWELVILHESDYVTKPRVYLWMRKWLVLCTPRFDWTDLV